MSDLDDEIARRERELAAAKLELYRLKALRTAQRRAAHCRRTRGDPAVLAKQRQSMLAVWRDPVKRARILEGQKLALLEKKLAAA